MGTTKTVKHFGLVGKVLGYSFSKKYFDQKFEALKLAHQFENYEFRDEQALGLFLLDEVFKLTGFSVTIPYKEVIIPYLDHLDESAQKTGAVNSVHINNGRLIGYNTDSFGFSNSLKPLLNKTHQTALILGTGGASKAIAYALNLLNISTTFVSRNPKEQNTITYKALNKSTILNHHIIINTTPLGTFPNVTDCPDIPYKYLNKQHIVFDLIYNPGETLFLKRAKEQGCITQNGLPMLHLQAEKSWAIWGVDKN